MQNIDLRQEKLPQLNLNTTTLDYHDIPISLHAASNKEELVCLEDFDLATFPAYSRAYGPYLEPFASALEKIYVRKTIAIMLQKANKILQHYGAEILVLDGYRPIELQRELWQYFIEKGREKFPQANQEQLKEFAGIYVSDPNSFDIDDFHTWPVHITGGAVDVTLQSLETKEELFMAGLFDQADEVSQTCFYEKLDCVDEKSRLARANRRLLFQAMTLVGFINYPHEWWHYDFGTQLWAMNGGKKSLALYGHIAAPKK